MTYYNNIPKTQPSPDSASATLQVFDTYSVAPLNVNASTYDAMVGFFTQRGFGEDSARSMSYVIIKQAVLDKINPFKLIENLKGLSNVEISDLITEVLNYNRYKTSSLGTASPFTPTQEVARNIIA
jgi:hypothetical protein